MALGSFISSGATDEAQTLEPSVMARRRKVLEALAAQAGDFSPIQSPWQGAARVVQGGLAGYELGDIDRRETSETKRISGLSLYDDAAPSDAVSSVSAALAGGLPSPGGAMGGGPTPSPAVANVPSAMAPDPVAAPAFGGGAAPMRLPNVGGGDIENRFIGALKAGGLTNPHGLAAMAAYANHESGYKPANISGSWADPSESGQPGTSGGILSWRGDRFDKMRGMTAGAKDPVEAQAKFAIVENPALTLALQNAKSPEEANRLMADAWKFAGYNRPGGEAEARLNSTRSYLARLGGQPAPSPVSQVASAAADMPAPNAQPAEFQIPGQSPSQATVAGALSGNGGRRPNLKNAMTIASSSYASPNIRRVAEALLINAGKPNEYGFQTGPDGTILRTDPRTGSVMPVYQGATKPDVDVREVNGRLVATDKRSLSSRDVTPDGLPSSKLSGQVDERRAEVAKQGLDPNDPRLRDYILTGTLPKENQQTLTAGDKKAINEAEDQALGLDSTLSTLSRAKELNGQTFTGSTAGIRGSIGTTVPGAGIFLDPKASSATAEFGKIMSMEAIKSMSQTLKGATTDREMDRFVDILGDPATPPEIRGRTIDRMILLAQRQRDLAASRMNEMRGGTYYKQGGGGSAAPGAVAPLASPRAPQPTAGAGSAPGSDPAARFKALTASGLTKQQAYQQMRDEGL